MRTYKVEYIINYTKNNTTISSSHSDIIESDSCINAIDFIKCPSHYKHLPTFQLWKQFGFPQLDIIIKNISFSK